MVRPFHLAIHVQSLDEARAFYGRTLGCVEGRSAERWVDFSFFGHQLSVHLGEPVGRQFANPVDGDDVPIPHFGVVLSWVDWHRLAERLEGQGVDFIIPPKIRFEGQVGEQATMFFLDPSGNALEFKSFQDDTQIFSA